MKVKSYKSGSKSRMILCGMVTNRTVLGGVADRWEKEGLFDNRWENLIAGWCVKHYRKYHKPPGSQIEVLFDRWIESKEGRDKDTAALVQKFLGTLSDEYSRAKRVQATHVLDLAGEYFTKVRAEALKDQVDLLLEEGKVDEAVAAIRAFNPVETGGDSTVKVLEDKEAMTRAFDSKSEPLIVYPGALGVFFGDSLEREGFISLEGPEKRGKTTVLLDLAWTAMLQGRRVAFFEVGDLSEAQIMRRFMTRAAGRPMNPTKDKPIRVPTVLGPPPDPSSPAEVVHEERTYKHPLDMDLAWKKCRKIVGRAGSDLLRLQTYPTNSVTVHGLNSALDKWGREGWHPDVIAIDYIDILAPMDGKEETRIQINKTWMGLSAMRQQRRCLILGATQTSAESYDADIITMKHFSENKLKRAHVTGSVGLNQSDVEKALGLYRFNWIVGREWEYDSKAVVHAAGCPALMSPLMFSTFGPSEDRNPKKRRK